MNKNKQQTRFIESIHEQINEISNLTEIRSLSIVVTVDNKVNIGF